MKNLVLILLFFPFSSVGQTKQKIDSIYYLIDTAKTSAKDRMWDIHEEYPALEFYIIQCPCLQYDQKPSFIYDRKGNKGQIISKKELMAVKLIDLATLILKVKQFTASDFKGKYVIFLLEPFGNKYILHQVRLLKPTKPRPASIDYESIPADSTKLKKNAINHN